MYFTFHSIFSLGLFINIVLALPEQGKWNFLLTPEHQTLALTKTIYANSELRLKVTCEDGNKDNMMHISYSVRKLKCYQAREADYLQDTAAHLAKVEFEKSEDDNSHFFYLTAGPYHRKCTPHIIIPEEHRELLEEMKVSTEDVSKKVGEKSNTKPASETTAATVKSEVQAKKIKRSPDGEDKNLPETAKTDGKEVKSSESSTTTAKPTVTTPQGPPSQYTFHMDGIFLVSVTIETRARNASYVANVELEISGPSGYLSAVDWPLLPFFGTMCVIYFVYGVAWLVVLALQWQDLLRIQFWIGGVIILGMIEKAVLYAEYQSLNNTGESVQGVMIFAELMSCIKRTLARMLVIIVSFGFGIVKPRLGTMLHRVVGLGVFYFLFCSAEGIFRIVKPQNSPNRAYLVQVPLTVLDTAICWWIFSNLVQTTRTLRLRRNVVKLSLYRHFTNTLVFACLASVAFMLWVIRAHRMAECITDWKELWVDIAYWHLLFSVILLVIMVLWRPTNNNQRYAFVPLIDAMDDEDEEQMTNDAFEGMKARNMKSSINVRQKDKDLISKAKAEDDLAWVEENIPASLADAALPSLLDSDEEIMNTKFEISKME